MNEITPEEFRNFTYEVVQSDDQTPDGEPVAVMLQIVVMAPITVRMVDEAGRVQVQETQVPVRQLNIVFGRNGAGQANWVRCGRLLAGEPAPPEIQTAKQMPSMMPVLRGGKL